MAITQLPNAAPRAGAVNARRPVMCRAGRSKAESIDGAEHGATLKA